MQSNEFLGPDGFDRDDEVENILYEMSNFPSSVTGLPQNIQVWVRTDLSNHGHNRYRIKVRKNKQWAGVFLVGQNPSKIADGDIQLSSDEDQAVKEFITKFSSLIISLIDEKVSSGQFENEILKIRGQ